MTGSYSKIMARLADVLGSGGFLAGYGDMETLTAVSFRILAFQPSPKAELCSGSLPEVQCVLPLV